MKKSLVISCAVWSLFQLLTPSCKKSIEPPVITDPVDTVTVIDTITPVDTTVVVTPDSTANYRTIQVTNSGTGLPAADCTVALFESYQAPFCSQTAWIQKTALGKTDENGRLIWKWDGQPLAGNLVIGANAPSDGKLLDGVPLGATPPKTISLVHRTPSFVKLHIDYQLDTLPDRKIELLTITPSPYCYAPQENTVLQLPATHPYDTTVVLTRLSAQVYDYKIRYLVDFSSYQTYISTGLSQTFSITYPASDTAEVHIVIK